MEEGEFSDAREALSSFSFHSVYYSLEHYGWCGFGCRCWGGEGEGEGDKELHQE